MATVGIAEAYLASGWCGRCGGKRNIDNNCANCDRWYNHPLLTVGGSLTLTFILLAFLGIRSLRDSDLAKLATPSLYAAQVPTFVPAIPAPTGATIKPNFVVPTATVAMPVTKEAAPKISPLEAQFTMLESLRQEVHANERAFRAQSPFEEPRAARKASLAIAEVRTATTDR